MLDITQFTVLQPAPVKLYDGKAYACRQISAGAYKLVERLGAGDDTVTVGQLVSVVADLLSAPEDEVERLSAAQLVEIIKNSAKPAEAMQQVLAEDAEKNVGSGAAAPAPRRKKSR